jgi:DNA polymerase-4
VQRVVLHLDLDAFFCAVEEIRDPGLRGQPFAVGGRPDQRGVVASCSYAARRFGVRSAMPTSRAMRLCPGLVLVSGHHHRYGEVSEAVMERLRNLAPLVEQISIDEAFVDISDIQRPALEVARRLQSQISTELSLPASIGIAGNKLVAKIATEVGKKTATGVGPPRALTMVPAGQEAPFLAPLPAEMLWGVGPKTASRLAEVGIRTIGDIARWPVEDFARRFGESARGLQQHALGIDDRPLVTEHEVKSISQETTFARDVSDDRSLERTLRELSSQVGRSLRRSELAGRTVRLKLRWPDFTTISRQTTLPHLTEDDGEIFGAALKLLRGARKPRQAVRLIGVGVSGLGAPVRQLGLWDTGSEKAHRLQAAVDELRERFGRDVIQNASADDIAHLKR